MRKKRVKGRIQKGTLRTFYRRHIMAGQATLSGRMILDAIIGSLCHRNAGQRINFSSGVHPEITLRNRSGKMVGSLIYKGAAVISFGGNTWAMGFGHSTKHSASWGIDGDLTAVPIMADVYDKDLERIVFDFFRMKDSAWNSVLMTTDRGLIISHSESRFYAKMSRIINDHQEFLYSRTSDSLGGGIRHQSDILNFLLEHIKDVLTNFDPTRLQSGAVWAPSGK